GAVAVAGAIQDEGRRLWVETATPLPTPLPTATPEPTWTPLPTPLPPRRIVTPAPEAAPGKPGQGVAPQTKGAPPAAVPVDDSELDAKRARLDEIKANLGVSAELRAAREALEAARKALAADETRQRQLEYDVEDRGGKIKDLDGRLYGGKIGNPKELASLQTE